MLVKDVMTQNPATASAEAPLFEAIQTMLSRKVSGLPVIDRGGALVGILSEGDLLRRAELGTTRPEGGWLRRLLRPNADLALAYKVAHGRTVGEVMSGGVVAIESSASLERAVELMESYRIKRLPVVDDDRLVGILSRADFLRALAPMLAAAYEEPATSDAEIERSIRAELKAQNWGGNISITVVARNGEVTLSGTVLSEEQRVATQVLAENVNGVRAVLNQLVSIDPSLQFVA